MRLSERAVAYLIEMKNNGVVFKLIRGFHSFIFKHNSVFWYASGTGPG